MSTLIAVDTVTVDSALLQEIKDVHSEFWTLLARTRHACSRPIGLEQNCHHFVSLLLEVGDQLALYFALEEAYGYFDDSVDVSPHTAAYEAEQLHNDHGRLYSQFYEIIERAEALLADKQQLLLAALIPKQLLAFHEALMIHEHRENELLMTMLDQVTGTGD